MEVASGEYGHEFLDRMVELIDNGRVLSYKPSPNIIDRYEKIYDYNIDKSNDGDEKKTMEKQQMEEEIDPNNLKFKCSSWQQFVVLFKRASKQIYSNKVKLLALVKLLLILIADFLQNYLSLRIFMHIFLGLVIGGLFWQMGNDATKTLFNFGFCFTIIITFMYIPMLPVLLECKYNNFDEISMI